MPELHDPSDVRARLERDRPWAAFSLADLDPPNAGHARWFGPTHGAGVVLVYGAYDPPIVVCHGEVTECDRTLDEPTVRAATQTAYLNVGPAQTDALARHFPRFEARPMVRMLLDREAVADLALSSGVVRLGPDDLPQLQRLYADQPPAFFLPSQLQEGVYFGVREHGALIAVAGTHVVSTVARVAALGNVHTRADQRARGLATAVTRAVCVDLLRLGIVTCVLNIVAANDAARRVYERVGFREHCRYAEGLAAR